MYAIRSYYVEGEVVAALFFEDRRPLCGPAALLDWRLNGLLTGLLQQGRVLGGKGERVLVRNNGKIGSEWIFFAGGGRHQNLEPEGYRQLIADLISYNFV